MAEARVPVDLLNPGQVFACLGLMEAAEILCGPCEGSFGYMAGETRTVFTLRVEGDADPVHETIAFLSRAEAVAVAPRGSALSAGKWEVRTIEAEDATSPSPQPDTPATLPAILTDGGARWLRLDHWADGSSGRDAVKFWAGSGGYPGVALARDGLAFIAKLGDNSLTDACVDPFALSSRQSSSFRFDWRRDYVALDAGFSPNDHGGIAMMGFPLVEMLAAIGLQNARPARPNPRDKLAYIYGASNAMLPTVLARAVLGGEGMGFPIRHFRMRLGWPGQEGQARCIIDAQEEIVH